MIKLFATVALLAISFLPNSIHTTELEDTLKESILEQEVTRDPENGIIKTSTVDKATGFEEASLGSSAALFIDKKSGEVLYQKNESEKLPMASITKLMTAIVAMDEIKENEVLTVPKLNLTQLDSRMWLAEGDRIEFSELLHGLLISSGADAALTISNHVSGGDAEFAALMNEKAKLLGLNNTEFTNSVGWDASNHKSTARDLVNLTDVALSNVTISEVVKKKSYTAESESGKRYILSNTNLLLGQSGYLGAKTGTTFRSGECLATYYNNADQEIVGVVLNSPDRFGETRNTIEWIKDNYIFYGS